MAAVEGNAARLVRIDPATGGEVTELDLEDFLSRSWGCASHNAAWIARAALPAALGGSP
jgi:hypothetical protein